MRRVGGLGIAVAALVVAVGAVGAGSGWLTPPPAAELAPAPGLHRMVAMLTEPPPDRPPVPAAKPQPPIAVEDFSDLIIAAAPQPDPEPEPIRKAAPVPQAKPVPEAAIAALPRAPARAPAPEELPVVPVANAVTVSPPRAATVVAAKMPTWRRFAVAMPLTDGAMIAVMIDDLGLNETRTRATIDLPKPLTLSFLPYGVYAEPLAIAARRAGHEVMLHLPMQPEDPAENPGPKALLVGLSHAELSARLDWYLDHLSGYVGVNNHMGSRFTQSTDGMALVLRELRRRGLLFVDSVTTPHSVALATARRLGVPSLARDVFLDNNLDAHDIAVQLAEVEAVARRNGQAIAIGHPHPATLEALKAWLPSLRAKGFTLAPVSAILRRRLTG